MLSADCLETKNTGEALAVNRVHSVFSVCDIPPLISPGPLYFIGLCVRLLWEAARCGVVDVKRV